ncbi:MAG: delta-60 repeat domain-containing protein [Xanthomonadales bacterium]|nr:delta-60 repeat domain-containing protein [Xanthomonadales bacterium]
MSAARPTAAPTHRLPALLGVALLLAWAGAADAFDVNDGYAPELNDTVNALAVQPSGHGIVGSEFTRVNGVSCARLCRLDAAGQVAAGFGPTGLNGDVFALLLEPDGAVIVGGDFTQIAGIALARLARMTPDGGIVSGLATAEAGVRATLVHSDGQLILGGDFLAIDNQPRARLARLDQARQLESTRRAVTGGSVNTVAEQHNGKLLLYGTFDTVGGMPRPGLARLSSPQAALYSLEQAGGSLRWLRGGAAPEIDTVPRIAISGFGRPLPESAPLRRVAGGWQFNRLGEVSGGAPLLRLQLQADTPHSYGTGRFQREYQRFNALLFSDGFEPGDPN